MPNVIIISVITLVSFWFQIILSKKQNIWLGLIMPAAFFVITSVFLVITFTSSINTVEGYGQFLLDYGLSGVIAQILKIGFIYLPTFIHLVIYFICRRKFRHIDRPTKTEKEIKKMIAKDLD